MTDLGAGVTREDLEQLQKLLEDRARLRGEEFLLSSGKRTTFYLNAKPVTLSAEGFDLVGRIMGQVARNLRAEAVGGLEIGAFPIALAVAIATHRQGDEIPCFVVRQAKKAHGTKERVAASYLFEQPAPSGGRRQRVLIVDDVVTTGKSVEEAIAGIPDSREVVAILALVTRAEDGGVAAMRDRFARNMNVRYLSLFESDLNGNLQPLISEAVPVLA